MNPSWRRWQRVALAGVALAWCATSSLEAQKWTAGRTPDGQPDLQGIWLNFDSTPFETPVAAPTASAGSSAAANVGPASEFADHTHKVSQRRQVMVVDPPDGRVPVMKWAEDERDFHLEHIPDAPEHETPWVRCITRGYPAGMFPAGYNNAYQIIQMPGLRGDGVRDDPRDADHPDRRPRRDWAPAIKQWNGEPRGRWEGDTLVVESTNYNSKGSIATSAATGRIRGIPQTDAMTSSSASRGPDANTIDYSVTIDDPKVYSKPWTVKLPLNRDDTYQMFEYSCHEGNYAMANALSFGRKRDAEAAGKASSSNQ